MFVPVVVLVLVLVLVCLYVWSILFSFSRLVLFRGDHV